MAPTWPVRLAVAVALGAGFGRAVAGRLGGAPRAVALGAGFGALWWALEAVAWGALARGGGAAPHRLGGGPAEASPAGLACYLAYGAVTGAALWGCQALGRRARPVARRLEVYVAAHCLGCAEARRLAAAAARRFPGLEVRTIDVDAAARSGNPPTLPEGVVAVPTYLLDGAVVALGNPEPEQLFARISSPLPARSRRPRLGGRAR
jgi:hypothetical protein